MEKKLHSFLLSDKHSNPLPEPHHTIQQSIMEEEFSSELAMLKAQKMKPRKEAVIRLLQMIDQQSVAEQH